MPEFGLIGNPLEHSFSKKYFTEKFERENLSGYQYRLFPLRSIEELPAFVLQNTDLKGFNVTSPYKKSIIPYLGFLDPVAKETGAVNTVSIVRKNNQIILKGFNTDTIGFEISLQQFVSNNSIKAIILGSGGASNAVKYVLKKRNIPFVQVSRNPTSSNMISYQDISKQLMDQYHLIINTTPVGTFPEINVFPDIPYTFLSVNHFLFDLVYNPPETSFLQKGSAMGCKGINGLQMLYFQADAAFKIWQEQ